MIFFRKLKEQEKGSITLTVLTSMLFITAVVVIAYISLANKSNEQSKKTKQIVDNYKVNNIQLVQEYKDKYDEFIADLDFENGLGDVNEDNSIDDNDVNLINGHINGTNILTGINKVLADINKDNIINSEDVTLLQAKINENNNT